MDPTVIGGKYRLLRQLGRGGMGTVHEAVHVDTGKHVAVKLMTASPDTSEEHQTERLVRFQREALAVGGLDAEHITQVYDTGIDEPTGNPYMAMELFVGEDVHSLCKKIGPLRPRLALAIAAQACMGLSRAHDAGIIHRDIKPGNLFLTRNERGEYVVKVLDFGIAKVRAESKLDVDMHTLTETGMIVGSPHYMSPEQAKGLKTIDARADLWSVGVVLYKCLTGQTPFDGYDTIGQVIVAVCSEEATSVQSRAPWVPPEVAGLLRRALRREPELRFQSAKEMLDELLKLLPNGPRITAEMLEPLSAQERELIQPRRSDAPTAVAVSSDRIVDASARSNTLATTLMEMATPRRHARIWLAVPVMLAVAAAALAMPYLRAHPAAPTAVAPAAAAVAREPAAPPPASEPASATPAPAPAPATPARQDRIAVSPSGATVEIDGERTAVDKGFVPIAGALGSVHTIRVAFGGRETKAQVILGEDGPHPSRVTLGTGAAPDQAPRGPRKGTTAGPPAPVPAAAAPPAQPGVGFQHSFE